MGQITRYNLLEELQVTFPWVEYIPWFNWHPSGMSKHYQSFSYLCHFNNGVAEMFVYFFRMDCSLN